MTPSQCRRLAPAAAVLCLVAGCSQRASSKPSATPASALGADGAAAPIRLAGTVEASRARTVLVPRLAGQTAPTLVITSLIKAGASVNEGDLIVEFDRQEQQRIATDRRAELVDLDGQIQKKQAEHAIARARDETELSEAERNVDRARLEVKKNDLIARVEAEKNNLTLEQSVARLAQLRETADLKKQAAAAELKILQIQRARAERALKYAESNALLMSVRAPFTGLAVIKQVWKGNTQAEVQEGEEVRPGTAIVDIVDPTAMRVRAIVSQADINLVAPGQRARVRLDAYPDLGFDGEVQTIAPLGVASGLSPKVRSFTALVAIRGMDPQLMPDLSASIEIVPPRPAQPVAARGPN